MFEKGSRLPLPDGVHKTAKGRDGYDRMKEPCATSSAYSETEETAISARDYWNDLPDYSVERTPWVLVIGEGPLKDSVTPAAGEFKSRR